MGVIVTLITVILTWRTIIKRRNQVDYIHLICAIIFTISIIFIAQDFGYDLIKVTSFIIPVTAAIIGLTHKTSVKMQGSKALTIKQIVIFAVVTVLLVNPVTLGGVFVLLGCGIVAPGPNADTVFCGIAGTAFMLSSLYFPSMLVIGIATALVIIIIKNRGVK